MKKTMPSGAELEIALAPFQDAKTLCKKVARELKTIKMDGKEEIFDDKMNINPMLIKDALLTVIDSEEIEEAISVCMKRCTYKGVRIDKDSFDSEESRGDYFQVCYEVAKENLLPFMKGLFAQLEIKFPEKKTP
jgi:hypothetical protein